MLDHDAIEKQLKKTGQLDQVQKLANSGEAASLAAMLDEAQLRQAAEKQDPAVIRAILQQVLSTDEGKRLAKKVKATMEHG